jgi:hypothetical protein
VETLEGCQLLFLPRELVQDICARLPSAAQALATCVAATLRRLTGATSDLVFLDLPRRVAKVLLSQPRGGGVIWLHLDLSDRVIPAPRQPGRHQACGGDLALIAGDDRGQVFPAGSCCHLAALFCEKRALPMRTYMHGHA